MLYALLLALTLIARWASWHRQPIQVPMFLLALLAAAWAFGADITDPLTISL